MTGLRIDVSMVSVKARSRKAVLMVAGVILNRRHSNDRVLVVYAFHGLCLYLGRE